MRSRRKQPEHLSHERWLVSYADFITLLFAFFVVLYASSQADHRKMAQLSAAIQGGFQQLGVFAIPDQAINSMPPATPNPAPPVGDKAAMLAPQSTAKFPDGSELDLDLLRRQLEQALHDEIQKREIFMHVTPEGLVVSLPEVGFFKSGDAHLVSDALPKLARIAKILDEHGFEIRVEGHTDSVPIHTSQYRSNWELSTARATEVVQLLVEQYEFDPRKVAVAGYGPYRPVANNDTAQGRQTNRRVDLVIIAQTASSQLRAAAPGHAGPKS